MKFPLCPPPLSFLACVGEPPMRWIRRNIGDAGLRGRSTQLRTLWKFLVGFRLTAPHTRSCAGAWDPNELQGVAWESPILCCLHLIICLKIKCIEHFPCLTSHFSINNVLKLPMLVSNNMPCSGLVTSGLNLLSQSLFYPFSKYGDCLVLSRGLQVIPKHLMCSIKLLSCC